MAEKVGIVAVAQTKFEKSKPLYGRAELVWEVIEDVLQQTGLNFEDRVADGDGINKVISVSDDFWDGRAISDMLIHPELGAYKMDVGKVVGDGTLAVYYGALSILSGYDIVMVVSHCKESETDASVIENVSFDPIYLKPLGLDYVIAAALQATRYMDKYGISPEQCAKAVVRSYSNAQNNPYALGLPVPTAEEILGSNMIASPLTKMDLKTRPTDGACAIILANEEKTKKLTDKPVWITGIGNCYDAHYLGDRELSGCDSLVEAGKRAYKMAGITNPIKEIDFAEISSEASYQELLWLEGLGFCDKGDGGKLIAQGSTDMGGEIPVNPSGGVLPGNPVMVSGMVRVAEAVIQLRKEAGDRQVPDSKISLAHGVTGACGQAHCVVILSN